MSFPRGNLPPINFAERSATVIESSIITTYEAISGRSLADGDPIRLFLLSIASIIVNQRSIIDFAAKQNLLSYAQDDYIDYIAELVGVKRNPAEKSKTTILFTLSTIQSSAFTIPAGTRVTNGTLNFATTAALEIPIGQLTGSVNAECETAGVVGNGYLPGQIKTLVQPIAFVQSAVNTTTSNGGAEKEGDESLVNRIRLAPSSFSTAGPVDAYRFWALTANPGIIDVEISTPSAGIVDVRALMEGGAIPGTEVLDQIDTVLNSDDIRPLTDFVQVNAPSAVSYNISVDYWIRTSDAAQSSTIQAAVDAAVNDYVLWQKTKIGRDITPDELTKRMISAGAKRVVITSPVFTTITGTQVAQDATISVDYQGLEDA